MTLQRATASEDLEDIDQAARLVSGCLGPESLRGMSQFEMRGLITACAPRYADLKDMIREIADTFDSRAVTDATARLSAFRQSSAGRVHIWDQATFAFRGSGGAGSRAAQNQEEDFPDYLAELRCSELGLVDNDLDASLAMIILGIAGKSAATWFTRRHGGKAAASAVET